MRLDCIVCVDVRVSSRSEASPETQALQIVAQRIVQWSVFENEGEWADDGIESGEQVDHLSKRS